MSARELQRFLGLTNKTAWRMHGTINEARYYLRNNKKQASGNEFEKLLAVLVTPEATQRLPDAKRRRVKKPEVR